MNEVLRTCLCLSRVRTPGSVWLSWIRMAAVAWVLSGLAGCAHVQPYQREFLADRIMDPASQQRELESDRKWMSTREGAMGGSLGAGGGCACN